MDILTRQTTDIIERKRAEDKLSENEKRFVEAERIGKIGNWSYEVATGNIEWSKGMYQIYGRDPRKGTITYESLLGFIHPDDRDNYNKYFERMLTLKPGAKLENLEYRLIRPSGEERWVDVCFESEFNKKSKPAHFFGTAIDITERKQMENKMRKNEARLWSIFQAAPIGIGLEFNRVIQDVNKEFCQMIGYSRSELIGKNSSILFLTDEEYEHVGKEKKLQILEGGKATLEGCLKCKNGQLIDVLLNSVPIDRSDPAAGNTFTVLNITDKKRAEEELIKNEKRYRLLTENTRDVIFRTRISDGTYEYVSPSVFEAFGCYPEDFYGNSQLLLELLPGGWDKYFHDKWNEIHEGKRPEIYEFPIIHKITGEKKWMIQSNVWIEGEHNDLEALQGRVTDVTEQKSFQEALVQSENRLRILIDTIPDLVCLKDRDGIYISCNAAFERFFGANEIEIVGKTDYDFVDKDLADFFRANDRKAMKANRASINEVELTFAEDGYNGLFETIKTPMRDADGNLIGVLGIARDISERERAAEEKLSLEKKLRQSQKMESIGNLAGGIAHDFNNILTSVIGFTELALDDAERDSNIEDNLQEVYTAGKRARALVKQILAFARQSEEKLKPIQTGEIVEEVLHLIRSSIPTTVIISHKIYSDSLIMGNETQVHQIILNLCTNAAHAMEDEGGTLSVVLKDTLIDRNLGKALSLKHGDYIELSVSDTGTGIPPNILGSIFEPYFTTKEPGEGTGMGLAMIQGIVESYGGKITVDSSLGKGSTFVVYLPVTRKRGTQRRYEPQQLPTGTERILFVDDEAPIAKMGSNGLERLGYQVTTRTSSVEALELFKSKPDEFDLIITDMTMPNMTGDKLAGELMKIRSDIPIVLCTGYSKKISEETALEIGIKAFAYKPIIRSDFAKTVRKVLDEAKSETQQ